MQIGMATTVPQTPDQKTALLNLALTLNTAARQAEKLGYVFHSPLAVIVVEGRDLQNLLASISTQVAKTAVGQ
jgi:hypothetical protein